MDDITEQWARTADPGPELDRVCAEWMGGGDGFQLRRGNFTYPGESQPRMQLGDPRPFSTDWSAAGELLEAMVALDDNLHIEPNYRNGGDRGPVWAVVSRIFSLGATNRSRLAVAPRRPDGSGAPLAIARAAAVLAARGIIRDDLEDA